MQLRAILDAPPPAVGSAALAGGQQSDGSWGRRKIDLEIRVPIRKIRPPAGIRASIFHWALYVVALWEAFYIEKKRFDLDTLRVPPTPISKSNDFL